MLGTMSASALETLQQANHSLRSTLLRLNPERGHCSAIRPQDFDHLRTEVLRAGECLRNAKASSESAVAFDAAALEKELLEYQSLLERLKHFLPDLHGRLLAEKTRLETATNRVAAITAWAGASRKTL